MKNRATIFTVAILAATGAQAWAQTVTVSDYSFTAGTAISASAMSTKLQALATAINYQANTTDANQTSLISGLRTEVNNLNTLVGTNNVGTLQSDVNDLQKYLNSAKWTYASSVLSYTGGNFLITGGNVGIGTIAPAYLLDVQSSVYVQACIANLNNGTSNPNSLSDPNEALRIIGGKDSGLGGAIVQFYTPNGTNRLGWIGQTSTSYPLVYAVASDRRLKDGIVDTRYSLDQLMKIKVRDFFYKSDASKKLQDGFIAQELYEVYPEAVSKPNSEEGTWGVDYGRLSPLVVKSIQDQQKEIDELKAENAELKARIAAIEKKLGL
jgi:hypothetical protein